MFLYKFSPRAVASPDAPQKPLVRKRARSGGEKWVQISRMATPSPAKRPRTGGSQQRACDHEEHQILSAAFAAQFWDKKSHAAGLGKLKKYVPSHKQGDVCPNGVPALVERGNDDNESDSE